MQKQNTLKNTKRSIVSRTGFGLFVFVVASVVTLSSISGLRNVIAANASCNTIAECKAQIAQNESVVATLRSEAASFEDAIARLSSQMGALQESIDQNTARQVQLQNEIVQKQQEIDYQRSVLASMLKTMYVDDQMTTIEMLATSKNLSEYVDKEEYRTAVQNKIQTTLVEIAELQKQLQSQKAEVEALLAQQTAQRAELAAAKAEQDRMLAYNESQQAAFNAQTAANQSRLRSLIEAQRRTNSRTSLSGDFYLIRFPGATGSFNPANYPWKNSGFSMSTLSGCGQPDPGTGQRDSYDNYGYCTRQCVSYAAWAAHAAGADIGDVRNLGSAKYWPGNVPRSYLHTSGAQPGDVLITGMNSRWGHAMYVEEVSGNRVRVSEYNQQLDGRYQDHRWITLD